MRLRLGWFTLLLGGAFVFGGAAASPAHAQGEGCALPEGIDETLLTEFQSTIRSFIVENSDGTINADATLEDMLGEAGDRDLPPGVLLATGVTKDLSTTEPCPEPGGGSKLAGACLGLAMSFDDKGKLLDMAADLSEDGAPIDLMESTSDELVRAFTSDNPFQVNVDGLVAYVGMAGTPDGPKNHTWAIKTFGVELDSGGDDNFPALENRNAGALNLKDDLPGPAKINAKFKIEGYLNSENGINCDGAGYFETTGGLPIADGIGVVALIGAGLGALFNARPAKTWRG